MNDAGTRRPVSWAMYDWANSAFATTVVAGFFPAFFKDYWSRGMEVTVSTFWLGVALTVGGLTVALLAPILGSIADRSGRKKRFLASTMALGVAATAGLTFVGEGQWEAALVCYVVGYVGWLSANVFYDSLLVSVAEERDFDRVSGFGFALGYLGGGLLFTLNVLAFSKPELFGIPSKVAAVRLAFLSVAVWWAVFSLPLFARVPEPPAAGEAVPLARAASEGLREVVSTFRTVREAKVAFRFLVAYWIYIDGVDTVITMAVDYGKALGFATGELISALLLVQFVAFPFALVFGWAGKRFGPKPCIFLSLGVYVVITLVAAGMQKEPIAVLGLRVPWFYALAFLIGTVQGGVQALSRSMFARLVPPERAGQFFGFYNMVGKLAAVLGPVLVGTVGRVTGQARFGMVTLVVLFVAGALVLRTVPAHAES